MFDKMLKHLSTKRMYIFSPNIREKTIVGFFTLNQDLCKVKNYWKIRVIVNKIENLLIYIITSLPCRHLSLIRRLGMKILFFLSFLILLTVNNYKGSPKELLVEKAIYYPNSLLQQKSTYLTNK